MHIIRTAALLIAGVAAGALITHYSMSTEHHSVEAVHAVYVPVDEPTPPAPSLGENDPIVPLVCGVNLNCSEVAAQQAAHAKPAKKSGNSRTVKTSRSSNGAESTTVTTKTPTGSSTVTKSRTAKGVTTTSRSTTVSK
jgi:hypothetical protein